MRDKFHFDPYIPLRQPTGMTDLHHFWFFSDVVLNPESQFQISFAATTLINTKICHEKDDETNFKD